MTTLEDLEQRIRERGVRVGERLEILRILSEADPEERLRARQEELLKAVREAAARLSGTAG